MDLKVIIVFIGGICVTNAKSWARSYDQDKYEEKLIRDLLRKSLSGGPPAITPPPAQPSYGGPPAITPPPAQPSYDETPPPGPPMLERKESPPKIDPPFIPPAARRCVCPPPPPPPILPTTAQPARRRSRLQNIRLEAAIRNLEAVLNEEGK